MKEKPVLFSPPMIQALLNTKPGTWPAEPIDPSKPHKWMTRRIVKTGQSRYHIIAIQGWEIIGNIHDNPELLDRE